MKGDGWKINFQTDQDYEIVKAKELQMLERRRMEADMKGSVNMGRMSQYDPQTRMVKEKLGLRMLLSQDPSIVSEKMLKDRLTAVKKQAEDHAVQLKQNGIDMLKKHRNSNVAMKNEESSVDTVSTILLTTVFVICNR